MSGFRDGAAMGVTHQFAQDGQLLSVSSQTGLLPRSENRR
jgi:acyl-CoA thioesterase